MPHYRLMRPRQQKSCIPHICEADLHWNNFDFSKISFTVDEDENEYLLQLQNTHKSGNVWSILKQIMVVIAAVLVLLFVIWPLFESLSYSAYNAIYD